MTGYIKKHVQDLMAKLGADDKRKLRAINEDRAKAWRCFFYMKNLVDFYAEVALYETDSPVSNNVNPDVLDAVLKDSPLECPCCYEKITGMSIEINTCKHITCGDCAEKMSPKRCPMCRADWKPIYSFP